MQNKFELQRERDFGENISGIFTILRSQFRKLLGSVILIAGPVILIFSIVSAYIGVRDLNALSENTYESNPLLQRYLSSFISYGVYWFGNAMVSLVTYSYLKVYNESAEMSEITVDKVWKESKKHLVKVIVASFFSLVLILLGSVFLIIPGLILAIFLSMYVPSIVFENNSVGEGFNRSFKLVSDNFWITLGLALVVLIISYFFSAAFSIPTVVLSFIWSFNSFDSLSQGEGFSKMSDTFSTMFLISGLIANLASMLVSIIPNLSIALHFFNLKEQKESSNLMDQISTMGSAKTEETESY